MFCVLADCEELLEQRRFVVHESGIWNEISIDEYFVYYLPSYRCLGRSLPVRARLDIRAIVQSGCRKYSCSDEYHKALGYQQDGQGRAL